MWLNASMTKNPQQDKDKFVLRLPDGMRERIKAEAAINNRSMNAEIIQAIPYHFDAADFDRVIAGDNEAWDAVRNTPLQDFTNIDNGMLPATKNDLEMTIKKIEELIDSKLK